MGGKPFDISLELFANLQNKATSMVELQKLLREELNRDVSVGTIYYKQTLCKKAGIPISKFERKPRARKTLDVEALNSHPSIHLMNPSVSV